MKTKHTINILTILIVLCLVSPQNTILAQGAQKQAIGDDSYTVNSPSAETAFDCNTVTEIPLLECQALVALYDNTNGVNWGQNTNWLQTSTPSDWYGVKVIAEQVTELVLSGNHLFGSIPPELGNLTNLTKLDLGRNPFWGNIPPELGKLAKLQYLDLSFGGGSIMFPDYGLTGSIPPDLGNLTNLVLLNLANNALSGGIPPELGKLTKLQILDLTHQVIWYDAEFYWYPQRTLGGTVPPEIANLINLIKLELKGNLLTGNIPPELGNLANLQILTLHSNKLKGSIPPELGSLVNLTELSLDNNGLIGTIPAELANLTNLAVFDLGYNGLTASDPALLTFLNTHNPGWETTQTVAPTNFHSDGRILYWTPITYSKYFELSYTPASSSTYQVLSVTADQPTNMYTISELSSGVYSFRLRSYNPWTYNTGDDLQQNDIWSDYTAPISVTIPGLDISKTAPDLALFGSLITYTLNIRNFSVMTMTNLTITDTIPIGSNYLRGGNRIGQVVEWTAPSLAPSGTLAVQYVVTATQTITNELYGVRADNGFAASGRPVKTTMANPFCQKVTDIPTSECLALLALYISTNGSGWDYENGWMQTYTPDNWFGVVVTKSHVSELNLSYMNLSGKIPPELGNLTGLTALSLVGNKLVGGIPTELGKLNNLTSLSLYSNNLSGSIPLSLGSLANLTNMELHDNTLSGSIPPSLGSLANLTRMDFHNNALSGSIPPSLGSLTNLTYMDFTNNALSGSIPLELANLTKLNVLGLWFNCLFAIDQAALTFLNAKSPYWEINQTVAPTDFHLSYATLHSTVLTWNPVTYPQSWGYYQVYSATLPAGPFILIGNTSSQTDNTFTIQGLVPGSTYYFKVRSFTPAHSNAANDLWSEYTSIIATKIPTDQILVPVIFKQNP